MSTNAALSSAVAADDPAPPVPRTLGEVVLTYLRHPSPLLLVTSSAVLVTTRLARGQFTFWDALIPVIVIALWPIQEWLIHVFILHWRPKQLLGRRVDLIVARKHREHHKDPWYIPLVFIPMHVFIGWPFVMAAMIFSLPTLELGLTLAATYSLMSAHYEWVHLLVHTRYRPKSRFYQRLWRNHRLHHFKNEHYWYGVTMLGGDVLLGTSPERDAVPTSPTARNLGESEGEER